MEGVLAPFSDVAFDVTFKPAETNDDLRVEGIRLFAEGVGPLLVTCSGACVALPTKNVALVSFQSVARKPETKAVQVGWSR